MTDRRDFLRKSFAATATLGIAHSLTACGGDGGTSGVVSDAAAATRPNPLSAQLKQLTASSVWTKVGETKLASAAYHLQGMVRIGDAYYISTVEILTPTTRLDPPANGYDRSVVRRPVRCAVSRPGWFARHLRLPSSRARQEPGSGAMQQRRVAVKDVKSSKAWYEQLLGSEGSMPMPEIVEWVFPRGGGLQVYDLLERAGKCSFTLVVEDIELEVRKLQALGIDTSKRSSSSQLKTVIITDGESNHIALAEALDLALAH